ncbi:MAG: iron-containing alcohol dehydrogenase [Lachnospiraceae bacterium]|nr:iron-containing alcohol dehydrogenase [Lachnospiraceae bacterium]
MGKRFCRTYQAVFKVGMYFLPWRMPKTLEGPGAVRQLPALIREKGYRRILIVTDKTLVELHLLDALLEAMKQEGLHYVVYYGVEPNPTDRNVEAGFRLYQKKNCDAMIAFGGGSPMDCAKAIGARAARPRRTVDKLQGLFRVLKRIPTIFTVPTTAGTGSETTIAAVITDSKTHHKASINDLSLMPRYAVLDPELTVGLPPKVTAATGMDALCHAVEAYTNNTYNSRLEKDLAKKAVKLIYDNLYTVYQDGSNLQARWNMQRAAFYAGRAFTRGCVGYVHAIGHTLGGLYGTPHGLAMSILLPLVMRAYGGAVYDKLADLCDVCGIRTEEDTPKAKAEAFIRWMEEMKEKMDIPKYPPVLREKDIDQIIEWAYKEANPMYPTPVNWSREDFRRFILSWER